jgi:predicted Zn-dependent protease
VTKPSTCSSRFSVEAVATHEFGHAFGLGHVSETYHPSLTMSSVIRACQGSESTLGLGDVRGLNALY